MAQVTLETPKNDNWEKPVSQDSARAKLKRKGNERWKFLVGGVLILGAIAYLVISGTLTGATYFITVNDVVANPAYVGDTVRISGAVIGETINHGIVVDPNSGNEISEITFTISHIPDDYDNLAEALHISVTNPNATRIQVVYNGDFPDLLQHEAQAILTGELREDGIFYASELLLKCPSRFEEGGSDDSLGEDHPDIPNAS